MRFAHNHLERAELLTPIPRAEVDGRLADGQTIEHRAIRPEPDRMAITGPTAYYLVEPIVIPVYDLPRTPCAASAPTSSPPSSSPPQLPPTSS